MAKVLIIDAVENRAGVHESCLVVPDCEAAFERLEQDADVGVVVIDFDTVVDEIEDVVSLIGEAWPRMLIVGQADVDRLLEFAASGVGHFLRVPWQIDDLLGCALDQHKNLLCARAGRRAPESSHLGQSAGPVTVSNERIGALATSLLARPHLGKISSLEGDDIQFLRENQAFQVLSDEALKVVHLLGDLVTFESGGRLFEIGDPCANLFVIKSGVVEIRRPGVPGMGYGAAAFLSAGDVLCEMGVLPGTMHQSMACAPDGAEVLRIERAVFMELLTMFPQLAVHMYAVMAKRLEGVVINAGGPQSHYRKLQGCLEHFDLATIVQSLIAGEERSGILSVYNEDNKVLARVQLGGGRISAVEMGRSRGRTAIYRLFQADFSQHSFAFRELGDGAHALAVDEDLAGLSGVELLLDAARVSDEVTQLRKTYDGESPHVLVREVDSFEWADSVTQDLAEQIFESTEDPVSLDDVIDRVALAGVEFFSVLADLVNGRVLRTEPLRESVNGVGSWLMDQDWPQSQSPG